MATEPVTVDWETALMYAGGERDFLKEVMNDLIVEVDDNLAKLTAAVQARQDFAAVVHPVHQVKGSASYLGCFALRDAAIAVQDAGRAAMDAKKAALEEGKEDDENKEERWTEIVERLYPAFVKRVEELKALLAST